MASMGTRSRTAPMRRSLVPACLLLMVALVGCSSEVPTGAPKVAEVATRTLTPSPTPVPTLSPTPRPTSKPTARSMTRREAATAYLKAATTFNKRMKRWRGRYGLTSKGTAQRTLQAEASKATGQFIIELRAIRFPATPRRPCAAGTRPAGGQRRDDTRRGSLQPAAGRRQPGQSAAALAATLRKELGLRTPPPTPGAARAVVLRPATSCRRRPGRAPRGSAAAPRRSAAAWRRGRRRP